MLRRRQPGRAARAERYVVDLMAEPGADLVARLASTGDGDEDHARWELRYARRAIGLLVAERDALDDRTASDVARALEAALDRDPNVAVDRRQVAEAQLNERLRALREASAEHGTGARLPERLGRVILRFAGVSEPTGEALALASTAAADLVLEANAALSAAYGEANLPADVRPSDLPSGAATRKGE